jgi:hypothetical protein
VERHSSEENNFMALGNVIRILSIYCRVVDLDEKYMAIGWREVSSALGEIGRRTAEKDWSDHRDAEVLVPQSWMVREQMNRAVA